MSEAACRRVGVVSNHLSDVSVDKYKSELKACKEDISKLLKKLQCHPILIRLAWHDAGTFDARTGTGGADGSIRFDQELSHGANAGLDKAVRYLKPIHNRHPVVSWADLIQLAAATSVEDAGGPKIDMKYGRVEVKSKEECPDEGNLPDAYPEKQTGAQYLRFIFHRMGLSDRDIVALSGAHTLGRAFKERSGTTECGYGPKKGTKFTGLCPYHPAGARSDSMGMGGGKSWTKDWLIFDNSYFTDYLKNYGKDKDLIWFPTDHALVTDQDFKKYFALYALDQNEFFKDFAFSFKKLSELGSKFVPEQGIKL